MFTLFLNWCEPCEHPSVLIYRLYFELVCPVEGFQAVVVPVSPALKTLRTTVASLICPRSLKLPKSIVKGGYCFPSSTISV